MSASDDTIGIEAALDEAGRLERGGDHASAVTIYEHLHRSLPEDLEITYRLGTAFLRTGRLEEAVPLLRQVVFHNPGHLAARTNLGNAFLLMDLLDKAEEHFQAVLQNEPDNRNALFGLASALIQQGRNLEALAYCDRLMMQLPNNAAALTLAGEAASDDPRLNIAIARYRQALKADPDYVPALLGLSRALYRRRRFDEALSLTERAALRQPRNAEALALKGQILSALQDFQAAMQVLTTAIELAPDNAGLQVEFSVAARRQGELGPAIESAFAAWNLQPTSVEAAKALGAALSAVGKAAAAREVLMSGGDLGSLGHSTRELLERLPGDIHAVAIIPTPPEAEPDIPTQCDDTPEALERDEQPRLTPDDDDLPLFRGF
ncbi:tetratricopeptide repeat protein [Stappia sp. F7233]|uniref:Tetratricopeptide repeat protein n=1 Tax=Stappia albiluteola TaxID=2758565 RepID=A0A839AE05_9HYPH|nr:tetratricopeptide repeat protein [Stappia albiluteola]MBA5776839.1 tetratricopeptide repeat protein [Stappia albiluteola]